MFLLSGVAGFLCELTIILMCLALLLWALGKVISGGKNINNKLKGE